MRWVSRQEAARLMGVTERTIHRWMAARKIRFKRDNRTGRVLVEVQTLAAPGG